MRKLFTHLSGLALTLLASSQAHALATDKFQCRIVVAEDKSGASMSQSQDFFVARLPLSASPAPDVRLTAGTQYSETNLETENGKITTTLNMYYKHAVRLDSAANPVDARQLTCVSLTTNYCPKSKIPNGNNDDLEMCSILSSACLDSEDPFGDNDDWVKVSIIGGQPMFDERTLGNEQQQTVRDGSGNRVGLAKFACSYKGTYY